MDATPVENVMARLLDEMSRGDVSLARYLDIVGEVAFESGRDRDTLLEEARLALGDSFSILAVPPPGT